MQLGVLNFLFGLSGGAVSSGQGGESAAGDLFSQLLGDMAGDSAGQQTLLKGEMFADVAPAALVAQEVPAENPTGLAQLSDLLNTEINPEAAGQLLQQLDAFGDKFGADDQAMLAQLKQSLAQIKESGAPQTLGAIVAQLPVHTQDGKSASHVVERMLAWVKQSLKNDEQEEASHQVAANESAMPDPVVQSLQAGMFRPADSTPAAAEETGDDRTGIDYTTITTVIPLSAQAEVPAWVRNIEATAEPMPRAELDAAIPPLAMNQEETLPEVNLPGSAAPEPSKFDAKSFLDHMKPLTNHAAAAPDESKLQGDDAIDATPVVPQVHSTSPASGTNHHALTINSPHAPLNHAPVVDQVHVAIKNGMKDGVDQMTIQLDPIDLGRVEVSMRTGADGQTQLSFIVDKAETLDALARDARSLEKALQDAGVKADTGSMQFNLRQQHQSDGGQGQQNQRHAFRDADDGEDVATIAAAASVTRNYSLTLQDGVDIRA